MICDIVQKINMEPKNGGLKGDVPLQLGELFEFFWCSAQSKAT